MIARILFGLLALVVLAFVLTLRGRKSAPALFFASTVATMVIVEFLRPYVHPGAGEDYYERAIPLSAVVLVMLFFTPVRRWFDPVRGLAEQGRSSESALRD